MNNFYKYSLVISFYIVCQSASAVETLGKQSVQEQHDAPIINKDVSGNTFLDIPKLLKQPVPNANQQVLKRLNGLIIEYGDVAKQEIVLADNEFIYFTGRSEVSNDVDGWLKKEIPLALKHLLHKPLNLGQVQEIQQHISDLYQEQGYPLMSVITPPQEVVNGIIKVRIHEFHIGKINYQFKLADGSYGERDGHWSSKEHLDKTLDSLKKLATASQEQVNKPITYLNKNPYRQAKVVFEPGEKVNATNINVLIDEKRPWGLTASYNNQATKASGTNRYSLGANLGNIPFEDDQLGLQATFGDNPSEFSSYSVRYKKPLMNDHTIALNTSYTDTASSSIPGVSSASKTLQIDGNYDVPVVTKGENWSLAAKAGLKYSRYERYSYFDKKQVGDAVYESVQPSVTTSVSWKDAYGSNKVDLSVNYNLEGITPDNTHANFQAFHNNTENSEYFFSVINYARQHDLSFLGVEGLNTETQVSWQITSAITAGADNFSLGGGGVLKAYQSGEVSGDEGWYLVQKLSYPAIQTGNDFIKQLQFDNFIEVGRAWGQNTSGQKLADIGLGLNLSMAGNANCGMTMARALENGTKTESGDWQFYISCQLAY